MDIDEILSQLDGVDWDGRDDFSAQVRSSYQQLSEGSQARITELETALSETSKKLQETQARNYELMVAATNPTTEERAKPEEGEKKYSITDVVKED